MNIDNEPISTDDLESGDVFSLNGNYYMVCHDTGFEYKVNLKDGELSFLETVDVIRHNSARMIIDNRSE